MPSTTNIAAPCSTPRMPGSASGFMVSACIISPEAPSAAPTVRPRSVRGMRSVHRTWLL